MNNSVDAWIEDTNVLLIRTTLKDNVPPYDLCIDIDFSEPNSTPVAHWQLYNQGSDEPQYIGNINLYEFTPEDFEQMNNKQTLALAQNMVDTFNRVKVAAINSGLCVDEHFTKAELCKMKEKEIERE